MPCTSTDENDSMVEDAQRLQKRVDSSMGRDAEAIRFFEPWLPGIDQLGNLPGR
jgi:hypothetical protein